MKVIDNFLPLEDFKKIEELMTSDSFPYYFCDGVAKSVEEDIKMFYFTHFFYVKNTPASDYYNLLVKTLLSKLDIFALIRVKGNCYTRSDKKIKHNTHVDFQEKINFKTKGLIYSINTCNGSTILDNGKEIKSVANRALFFDPMKPHCSTNCTDQKARFNINVNYI